MNFWKKGTAAVLAAGMLATGMPLTVLAEPAQEQDHTFSAVCMNVDGLPQKILGISINEDGPGESGTKAIGERLETSGWDIIGVSEDFNYNDQLVSAMTSYQSGTHRGGVSWITNNTDGLNLFWKNQYSVAGEAWTPWNTSYSTGIFNTGNGADGMINKGYRYYAVTLADGVTVDVYTLHMDADSDEGDIKARESQLTQLADAIKASHNGNPILIMGDTNSRYTREHLETLLIDAINEDSRFTIQDAWVEKVRNGSYPTYGADAIVAVDKGGTYAYPDAEIVDKIFYINNTDSDVTLTADSYRVCTDFVKEDGTPLADHWPVEVVFQYAFKSTVPEPTATPTAEPTAEPTAVPTAEPTAEPTAVPTAEPTAEPTAVPTAEPTAEPTAVPTAEPTAEPTATPTAEPTAEPTATPTAEPTAEPTATPTAEPTAEPTAVPTAEPTAEPTATPTAEPTAAPTATPAPEETPKLQDFITDLPDTGRYVLAFNSTVGRFAMVRGEDNAIEAPEMTLEVGDEVTDDNMIWTVTKVDNGWTISADIDGETQYLARLSKFVGYGFSVGMQKDPFVWTTTVDTKLNSIRFKSQIRFGSTYYLRYYNARLGWIASLTSGGIKAYPID